ARATLRTLLTRATSHFDGERSVSALMRDKHFTEAKDLLDHFLSSGHYGSHNIFEALNAPYIFRGQSSADLPLLPTAFRPGNGLSQFTPQSPGCPIKSVERADFDVNE